MPPVILLTGAGASDDIAGGVGRRTGYGALGRR